MRPTEDLMVRSRANARRLEPWPGAPRLPPSFKTPRCAQLLRMRAGASHQPYSNLLVDAGIDLARVALEHLGLVGRRQGRALDIPLGVVEAEAGLRVVALHGAHHLRGEQDVVDRNDLEQQVDARLM